VRALIEQLAARRPTTDGVADLRTVPQRQADALIEHNGVAVGQLPGEPILDNETWERLTTLFASRRRGRPVSEMYLCSGIVCCGK
jgi:hypothetical protein